MSLIVSIIIVITLTVFFGWLVTRAWRAIIKWPGVVVAGLLGGVHRRGA